MTDLRKNNHYVPQFYLQYWSNNDKTVWMYRRLVSNSKVPWWTEKSIEHRASMEHLYNHHLNSHISDEFECWLNTDVESPAKCVLDKINEGHKKLNANELKTLLRYVAAQNVRTPAYYAKHSKQWAVDLAQIIVNTVQESLEKAQRYQRSGNIPPVWVIEDDPYMPIDVSFLKPPEINNEAAIKVETPLGRVSWLSHIKRLATERVEILHKHKWSIIDVAHGFEWATSDDPVICLAYWNDMNYHFDGGWKQKGSEILFPLGPKKLLYTQVGKRANMEIYNYDAAFSARVQKFILQHAFLEVYSKTRLKGMFQNCPRTVDATQYNRIKDMLDNWNIENEQLEKEFSNP